MQPRRRLHDGLHSGLGASTPNFPVHCLFDVFMPQCERKKCAAGSHATQGTAMAAALLCTQCSLLSVSFKSITPVPNTCCIAWEEACACSEL